MAACCLAMFYSNSICYIISIVLITSIYTKPSCFTVMWWCFYWCIFSTQTGRSINNSTTFFWQTCAIQNKIQETRLGLDLDDFLAGCRKVSGFWSLKFVLSVSHMFVALACFVSRACPKADCCCCCFKKSVLVSKQPIYLLQTPISVATGKPGRLKLITHI